MVGKTSCEKQSKIKGENDFPRQFLVLTFSFLLSERTNVDSAVWTFIRRFSSQQQSPAPYIHRTELLLCGFSSACNRQGNQRQQSFFLPTRTKLRPSKASSQTGHTSIASTSTPRSKSRARTLPPPPGPPQQNAMHTNFPPRHSSHYLCDTALLSPSWHWGTRQLIQCHLSFLCVDFFISSSFVTPLALSCLMYTARPSRRGKPYIHMLKYQTWYDRIRICCGYHMI